MKRYFRSDYSQHHSEPCENAVCIPLTEGMHALIDAKDFDKIGDRLWGKVKSYAVRHRDIYMHKVIMGTESTVDHKNRNSFDNRKSNLRLCSRVENNQNVASWGKTSAFKGVHKPSNENIWIAQIRCNGTRKRIGRFKTEIEAALAYDREAALLHGEFAFLNFPALQQANAVSVG